MSNTWRTTGLTLDTGALIALDHPASALLMQARLDEALRRGGSICIPVGVVAQAWRGGRPVKLARLIRSHDVDIAVMTLSVAAPSAKCAPTVATPTPSMSTSPCVREREHAVVTSDPDDLARIDPGLPLIRVSASLAWATTSQDQGSAVSPSLRQSLSRNR